MIGEKLRQLRSEEGNTQLDLAKAVDVSVKTVKNWESDINDPDLSHAIAILHSVSSQRKVVWLSRCPFVVI